jgi:hypothetical protein
MSILSLHRGRLVKCVTAAAAVTAITVVGTASAADVPRAVSLAAAQASLQRELTATITGAPILGGFTSQGGPVVLQVSSDGKRVQRAEIALVTRCTSDGEFVLPDALFRLGIRRNGRVRFTAVASFNDGSGDLIKSSHSCVQPSTAGGGLLQVSGTCTWT